MHTGPVSGLPRRFTFGGKRSAVTFSSLTAEINKVVKNTQIKNSDKKIKAIKNLIQQYVDVKGTENKPKLEKALSCCMKLKDRQDLVGVVAKSFGKEIIEGVKKDRNEIKKCVTENLKNIKKFNEISGELKKLKLAKINLNNPSSKYYKLPPIEKEKIKSSLDEKITNKKRNLQVTEIVMNKLNDVLKSNSKEFQNKYGVPHGSKIDLPKFD
tara:strand:+ start:147 stop:782 length:636 start_codon:yes stop_codon:yes gene_type:complete